MLKKNVRELDIQKPRDTSRDNSDEGSLWELSLLAVFFVLVFSAIARADGTASASDSSAVSPAVSSSVSLPMEKVKDVSYSAQLLLETSRTLSENESTSYSGTYQLTLGAAYKPMKLAGSLKLGYTREYSYELEDGSDGAIEFPAYSLSKSFTQGPATEGNHFRSRLIDSVSIGLGGALPAGREAERQTFRGSIGPSVSVKKAISKLTLVQGFGYSRGFYEYDIRDNGRVNAPDVYRSMTSVGYDFTEKLSVGTSLVYSYAVSFQGVGRANTQSMFSLDYAFSEMVAASVGVGTLRGTLEADGQTNRLKFFDSENAQAFLDLVISI